MVVLLRLGAGAWSAWLAFVAILSASTALRAVQSPDGQPALFTYATCTGSYVRRDVRRRAGFEIRDLSITSPHGGTVDAFLVVPERRDPVPLVIYGHWGNGTRASFLPEAMLLARAGVASFIADAPFARALGSYRAANGPEAREVYVQAVVDTRCALDLLAREPAIDRTRIGYAGLSFGSQVGAILAGIEPRIRAFVLMGGLPSLARALEQGQRPDQIRLRENIQDRLAFGRFLARPAEIDSERFVRSAHPPILFQFGTYDAAIPARDAREFAAVTSEPKEVRWYDTGHEFNDLDSLNDRFAWLGRQLRFAPPCVAVNGKCETPR